MLTAIIVFQLVILVFTWIIHSIVERSNRRQWSRLYGTSGLSPTWTGQNGLRYRYDLGRHKIIKAEAQ